MSCTIQFKFRREADWNYLLYWSEACTSVPYDASRLGTAIPSAAAADLIMLPSAIRQAHHHRLRWCCRPPCRCTADLVDLVPPIVDYPNSCYGSAIWITSNRLREIWSIHKTTRGLERTWERRRGIGTVVPSTGMGGVGRAVAAARGHTTLGDVPPSTWELGLNKS
jgi:hypothetical protein